MRTSQAFVHWLEQGRGAVWLRRSAVVAAALLLTATFAWRQFHGLPTEFVLQQADLARQVAAGAGFTTRINYPQTYAVMQARGVPFDEDRPYPELHHAPLYALAMAAVFAVMPGDFWSHTPEQPGGWWPDYVVLLLNLALFWTACALVWRVAKRLFDERVAWIATVGTAVSVPFWQHTVAVDGLPLFMILALLVVDGIAGFEQAWSDRQQIDRGMLGRIAWLGGLSGLLFLAEYSAGLMAIPVVAYVAWRVASPRRWVAVAVWVMGGGLIVAPWLVRNTVVAGHPLGLAWQNLALKAGDSTAEPHDQRALMAADAPGVDLNKLGNKGLTGMERNLKERLWSGGGMMLTAFFVAGLAYQFRHGPTNRVRWFFAATLLLMLAGQPFFNSGESPRLPAYYLAPVVIVFGAGFFLVLVESQVRLATHWRWVAGGLLLLQGLPLVRDAMEPRKIHFHFPPYYPNLFMELRRDAETRFLPGTGLAADVPAGSVWYGQTRVWAKPVRLRDFRAIIVEQNIGGLLLTPVTLDRPFFVELAGRNEETIRLSDSGGWGGVYAGLVTRQMPADFPLSMRPQKLTDNMVLLVNPTTLRRGGN